MVRKQVPRRQTPRRFRRGRGRVPRGRMNISVTRTPGIIGFLRLARIGLGSLPISGLTNLLTIFDFAFNLIANTVNSKKFVTGAYSMFGVNPAVLLFNSPLLARSSSNYSFPGYPVSMKWIRFKLRNTTQNSERSGRWAAVFIPYRETHDASHYVNVLKDMTFAEVAAMPHSKVSDARHDIVLSYKMTDRVMYCAQPREISEEIGIVFVIWDTGSRADYATDITSSTFSCEVELEGGCRPHVIFGPQHRIDYPASAFNFQAKTKGDEVRIHDIENGHVSHVSLEDEYELM